MKKIYLLYLATALAAFQSCRKETDAFDGPSLNDIYGEFSIIENFDIINRSVDFAAGQTTSFSAIFSKSVSWQVKISGLQSGGVKYISGISNMLDNSNSLWNGSTTNLPMFTSETCAVELTFENEIDTIRDTLEVISPKINEGLLLSDFETGWNPAWSSFVQSGADMSFVITDNIVSAQGSKYYDMGGAVDWDYLIGLIDIPGSAYGAQYFPLNNNPDNIYFNVLLNNPPGITNSIVLFQFREDDNGDGIYTDGAEDMFSIQVVMTETGWQQISSKYADLATLINGVAADPIGNGIHEPDKLLQVSILMLANPATGYSQALMDFLIFTDGKALEP